MFDGMYEGFAMVFTWYSLMLVCIGVTAGTVFGAVPGLTGGIAIAILLPFTFYMNIVEGMCLLGGIYVGGEFGGSIAAVLFGTPGSPSAGITVLDGYTLAQKGFPNKALQTALYASAAAGLCSSFLMVFLSAVIASLALLFGPAEYFSVILFSLVLIATIGVTVSWERGFIAVVLGLLFSFVGSDPVNADHRLTFGSLSLTSGLPLIPVLVGLFVGAEVIKQTGNVRPAGEGGVRFDNAEDRLSGREFCSLLPVIGRGTLIGTVIGALPGLNSAVAAMLNYGISRKCSKHPELYGTGCIEGIAAPESANNGTVGPTLCPLLTLGIPGSGTAALFLGALLMQGITPGPMIFETTPYLMYGMFFAFALSSVMLVVVGRILFRGARYIPLIPVQIINSCIILFCAAGAYAANSLLSDVFVLLFFMTIGYFMQLFRLPIIPLLIAYLLGQLLETNLRRALLVSDNGWAVFFTQPLSACFLAATAVLIAVVAYKRKAGREHNASPDRE